MEIKILQVFLGADGLPYKDQERKVHFPIVGSGFQGASNTTKIRFYYDELVEQDDTETAWVACAKLPNGKIGSKVLETDYDSTLDEHYALLELGSFYFQYKGDVYISLQGYQGGVQVSYDEETELYTINGTPTIAATGSIKLSVNYATQFVGSGETSNVNFQRILADLGTKLGIRAQSEHVEELPSVGQNDIFYVVNDDPNDPNLQNIYVWNENTQSYVWVGDNTLDLGNYYTTEQGEDFEEQIENRVTSVENELTSVASGSPAGVYATVSDLTTANPDHSKIYLVTADGKWYYWNGSAWTAGGQYLNNELFDEITENTRNIITYPIINDVIHGVSVNCKQNIIKLNGTVVGGYEAVKSDVITLEPGDYRISLNGWHDVNNSAGRVYIYVNGTQTKSVAPSDAVSYYQDLTISATSTLQINIYFLNNGVFDNTISVQVEKGTNVTDFIKPITAVDLVARETLDFGKPTFVEKTFDDLSQFPKNNGVIDY